MYVSASKNCETIKIRTELDFYCNGSGNSKCQSREVKRFYYQTGKFSPKIPCFAKSCRKGCARPARKHLIYESWGAKKPSSQRIERNSQCRWTKWLLKSEMFFHFISENAILEVKSIQQNNSFSSLNEPKTILKTTERSYHITCSQRKFQKMPCLCKLNDILWLQSSELY